MHYFIVILSLLIGLNLFSQKSEVSIYDSNKKIKEETSNSKLETKKIADEYWLELIQNGHLCASIDSIVLADSLHHKIYIYRGEKYSVDKVITNIPSTIKSQIGFKENYLVDKKISTVKLKRLIENTLTYCNNNGHPFAFIKLDQTKIHNQSISLDLNLTLGPLVTIDSIILNPEIIDQKKTIQQIINIKNGDVFNQNLINEISTRIKETPYMMEINTPEYEFINNKVSLFINAKNRPANFINGILGVQPQNDGSIDITGDANVKFINGLKKGETISLKWRKMYAQSQSLNSIIELPYLLNSSFGLFNNLDMLKKIAHSLILATKLAPPIHLQKNQN